MKTKLAIGMILLAATLLPAQTTNLTALLQQGLFEEQANRNLDGAIADYSMLAAQFDKDRQLAATAVFRLGECYRAQGRTNEAAMEYQRILGDFSDQTTLATLSREDLAGMGMNKTETATAENSDAELYKKLAGLALPELEKILPTLVPDAILDVLLKQRSEVQTQRASLIVDYPSSNVNVVRVDAQLDELNKQIEQKITGMMQALKLRAALGRQDVAGMVAAAPITSPPSPEAQELEHTKKILAQLQGWDLPQLRRLIPTLVPDAEFERLDKELQTFDAFGDSMPDKILEQRSDVTRRLAQRADEIKALLQKRVQDLAEVVAKQSPTTPNAMPTTVNESPAVVPDEEQTEIASLQQMIQNSPDLINAPENGSSIPPLIQAAMSDHLRVASFLLDNHANIEVKNSGTNPDGIRSGETPLTMAAFRGHKAMVGLLLSRGADINARGGAGYTALHQAASHGFNAVVEVLLASNADVNVQNDSGTTPLCAAAGKGQLKIVQMLLAAGAKTDIFDSRGSGVLDYAIGGSPEVLQALLAAGTYPNTVDSYGRTPLSYAAEKSGPQVVKLLLAAKADPNGGTQDAPLLAAVYRKDSDTVEMLLQAGANPNAVGNLNTGGGSGLAEIRRDSILLNHADHLTPLFLATYLDQPSMVQRLLKYKADPDDAQTDGHALIFNALDHPEILNLLLDAGAKTEVRDVTQVGEAGDIGTRTFQDRLRNIINHENSSTLVKPTPLLMAVGCESNVRAVAALLQHGADPNAADDLGTTPLHRAARQLVDEKVFALLLEHKADPNVRNQDGKTPLDLVKEQLEQSSQDSIPRPMLEIPAGDQKDRAEKIITLLHQHGALDHLPDWNSITMSRPSTGFSYPVFKKGTNDWNQFTLLELVYWMCGRYGAQFRFPDLSHIVIVHPAANGGAATRMEYNLLSETNTLDCAKDLVLEFGDVVEIPERGHTLAEQDNWLNDQFQKVIQHFKVQAGEVRLAVAGGNTVQVPLNDLQPTETYIGAILRSSQAQNALTSSSDLTRVEVTRRDLRTKKTSKWTMDCSQISNNGNLHYDCPDLLLRDGDVIEVPEKQ